MASSSARKSTNVRLLRSYFSASERVAPALAARVAARMWFTLPPEARGARIPEGGAPFQVESQGAVVRGQVWGHGPVVYLVHGWGGRGSQLAGFVEPLVRRGHQVVLFDAPSHGDSDPGPSGPRSGNGVEFGKALDAVGARFGPARALVAHSMGAVSSLLTLKYGWLSTERLVLLAPMSRYVTQFDAFAGFLGIGPRTRRRVDAHVARRVGVPVEEFDVAVLAEQAGPIPTLVVHDRTDRQTSYVESAELVRGLPEASMITTHGLGHQRLLRDPQVIDAVSWFVDGSELTSRLSATA